MEGRKTNTLFTLQMIAILLGCVFAAIFNSHLKTYHPTQTVGAIGLLISVALFISLTAARIWITAKSRVRR